MTTDSDQSNRDEAEKKPLPIAGFAVPGGLLIGMGVGFLTDELVAGFLVMMLMLALTRER